MRWPSPFRPASSRPITVFGDEGEAGQSQPDWYIASQAQRFGIDSETAAAILRPIELQYLGPGASTGARARFRQGLHLEELMLARACARGHEAAWAEFWPRYQGRMRAAARSLHSARGHGDDPASAHDLADGLFAELFGLRLRHGERVSKLDSYTGIGSLEGWLYALLAQAHVDQWRRERRLQGLPDFDEALDASPALRARLSVPPSTDASPATGPHLEAALETVLSGLTPPQRLLLSLYFLDGKTLLQIGFLLQVHESTVSRRLDRLLGQLRRQTRRELGRRGLSPGATAETMRLDPRWLRIDVRKSLVSTQPEMPHGR